MGKLNKQRIFSILPLQKKQKSMNTSDIKQPRLLTLDDVQPIPKASRIDTLRLRRQNNLEKRYDTMLLAECEQSWQNKDEFRQQRARSLRYLFGNQWGDLINYRGCYMTEEKYMREIKRNEPLKNNIMVSLWSSVVGIHAKQETEPVCYARSENAKSLSDMMSSALQTNWQNTYMADMLDVVFAEYLISGAAFVRETYEERDQLHDAYTDYINPYYMFWNAGSDPAHRDVTLIGCLHDITPEELFFRFAKPQYALTVEDLRRLYHINALHPSASTQPQNDINSYNNVSFSTPSDGSMLRVIEVWRQEVKPRYQCHDPLAVSQVDAYFRIEKKDLPRIKAENEKRRKLYAEQQVPKEKQALITTREIVDKYWHFAFLTPEGFILAEGETPYDFKSHPFSMSLFPYVNGEIHSFISFFIDQQRYINRLVAMDNMAVTSAVKGMKFLPLSLKPDEMTTEEYANQTTEYDSAFVYDDRKSRTGARPEFFTHSAFNIGTHEMLQTQLNLIHEVSGVSGALQGKTPASGTSAARYQMETQNATTTIYPLIKRFTSFKERLALKKVITMQQFYEEGRDITKQNADRQTFYQRNNARNVQFLVSIKESMSTAAYAQLGNDFLDKLFDRQAIDPMTYIRHYDAPFVDQLLVELQNQQQQMENGQMSEQPIQVPGANQAQSLMASELLKGEGQLFTRKSPGQPLTAA